MASFARVQMTGRKLTGATSVIFSSLFFFSASSVILTASIFSSSLFISIMFPSLFTASPRDLSSAHHPSSDSLNSSSCVSSFYMGLYLSFPIDLIRFNLSTLWVFDWWVANALNGFCSSKRPLPLYDIPFYNLLGRVRGPLVIFVTRPIPLVTSTTMNQREHRLVSEPQDHKKKTPWCPRPAHGRPNQTKRQRRAYP